MDALSLEDKAAYDEVRFAWLGADTVLGTRDTAEVSRMAEISILRNFARTATARRGLAISGAPGLGKSTVALNIGKLYERKLRQKDVANGADYAPVAYVIVPPGATPKGMMLTFAHFLGLPQRNRATAQDIAIQLAAVFQALRTSLVIVDEVHNLQTQRSAGAEAASALKTFSETCDAVFIYAGIDLLASDLFAGAMGRQLKGRMMLHEMRPYGFSNNEQKLAWTQLVAGCETLLPLADHPRGSLEALAPYIFDRTGGSIGSLRALVSDAGIHAILNGSERVTRTLLDSVKTDRQAEEFR